jgi:hypothetical protein
MLYCLYMWIQRLIRREHKASEIDECLKWDDGPVFDETPEPKRVGCPKCGETETLEMVSEGRQFCILKAFEGAQYWVMDEVCSGEMDETGIRCSSCRWEGQEEDLWPETSEITRLQRPLRLDLAINALSIKERLAMWDERIEARRVETRAEIERVMTLARRRGMIGDE